MSDMLINNNHKLFMILNDILRCYELNLQNVLFTTIEASFFLRIHKNSCQECSPSQTDFIKITRQEQYFRYPNF